jgi:hypothetical protein
MMLFEQIEKKKREYTDKYVIVDATRPELARFRDIVGRVKTVNMSGRALVEFLDYHLNIGWYDIDPEFLKVVDKPPPKAPKPEGKKPAAKPVAKAEARPAAAAKAPAAKAAAPAAKAGKPSVADILAAARGGKSASKPPDGEAASAAGKAEKPSESSAATKPQPAKPAVDRSKMSVADMLAAARAGGAGGAAAAKAAAPAPAKPPAPVEEVAQQPPTAVESAKTPATAPKSTEKIDKSKMWIADMVAWCRQHDAKK